MRSSSQNFLSKDLIEKAILISAEGVRLIFIYVYYLYVLSIFIVLISISMYSREMRW